MGICKNFKKFTNTIDTSDGGTFDLEVPYCDRPESPYSFALIKKEGIDLFCKEDEQSKVCPFRPNDHIAA